MIPQRYIPWLIGGTMLILVSAVTGWSLGDGAASGKQEANAARQQAFDRSFALYFESTMGETSKLGYRTGWRRGDRSGTRAGSREGDDIGSGNVRIEAAVDAAKAADLAASSAEAEIAARQPNCGIVAAAPSWCPTSGELATYRAEVRAARRAAEQAERAARAARRRAVNRASGRD